MPVFDISSDITSLSSLFTIFLYSFFLKKIYLFGCIGS